MSTFDFRVLLETVEGKKTSYISQSFVDTSVDLVLSSSQVYNRITSIGEIGSVDGALIVTASSNQIKGRNSTFQLDLNVGDTIKIQSASVVQYHTVENVASKISMSIVNNWTGGTTDTATGSSQLPGYLFDLSNGMISCSYQNSLIFSGSDFNTNFKFKDNNLLSASLQSGNNTGSINFHSTNTEYDRLLRYKFIGDKVCNVLGLPSDQWVYTDQVRLPADDESNFFQGNVNLGTVFISDTLTFANNSNINSDIPFLIDTGSDRYIKFIDTRDEGQVSLQFGYDKDNDEYEILASTGSVFNIKNLNTLEVDTINAAQINQVTSSTQELLTTSFVGDQRISGSLIVSSSTEPSIISHGDISASGHITASSLQIVGQSEFLGSVNVSGNVTATTFTTEQITTNLSEGSTAFGDTNDDIHGFSGSIKVIHTGSSAGFFLTGSHLRVDGKIGVGTDEPSKDITVSGDISASGTVYAEHFTSTDDATITEDLTVLGNIELGHVSDTSLTRASAGDVNIEGNIIYRADGTDVPVADGGTGASTLTDGGVLLGSGTGAITAMAVLTDGQMIVGDGTTDPVAESGATLRTSIGVGTGDNVRFTNITGTGNTTLGNAEADTHTFVGHITASNNISASGGIIATGDIETDGTIIGDGLNINGTTTFNEGNITHVGDINCDSISVDHAGAGLTIDFGGTSTATNKIKLTDNLGDALNILEGSNSYMSFITTNGGEKIKVAKDVNFLGDITSSANITAVSMSGDGSGITGVTGEWDGTLDGDAQITGSLIVIENITTQHITASGNISSSGTGSFDGGLILGERILMSSDTGGNQKIMFGDSSQNIQGAPDFLVIESDNQAVIKADNKVNIDSPVMGVGAFTTGDTAGAVLHISGTTANQKLLFTEDEVGTDIFVVSSSGNVGIGTSTPTKKLEVAGDISASGVVYARRFESSGSGDSIDIVDSIDVTGNITASGGASFGENVGIGTVSPTVPLQVEGNISGGNAAASMLLDLKSVNSNTSHDAGIRFYKQNTHKGSIGYNAGTDTVNVNYGGFDNTHLNIDSSGKVGIGTSSPTKPLQVSGDISASGELKVESHITASGEISSSDKITGANLAIGASPYGNAITTAGADGLRINMTDDHYNSGSFTIFSPNTTERTRILIGVTSASAESSGRGSFIRTTYNTGGSYALRFIQDDEKMRIDHGGNVGIGTTTPQVPLQIVGGDDVTATETTGIMILGAHTTTHLALDDNEIQARNASSANPLYIQNEGGNTFIGGQGKTSKVGIKTHNPTKELQVEGSISASGDLDVDGNITGSGATFSSNVGIGTAIPLSALHVEGDIRLNSSDAGESLIFAEGNNTRAEMSYNSSDNLFKIQTDDGSDNSTPRITIKGEQDLTQVDISGNVSASIVNVSNQVTSNTFTSGFAGNGFRLDYGTKSSLTVDDLTIRGTMSVFELLIHQIRATNGSLFVSNTGKLISSSLSTVSNHYSMSFDTGSGYGHSFQVGDLVRAQRFVPSTNGSGSQVFKSDLHIISVEGTGSAIGVLTASIEEQHPLSQSAPQIGYEYVRIGSTTTASRQGSIYLTSDDEDAPFIDVVDGLTAHSQFNTSGKVKVRMGKLDGITTANSTFGSSGVLDGYGLYASGSVFLEGSVNATNGLIGGWTISNAGIGKNNVNISSSGVITLGSATALNTGNGIFLSGSTNSAFRVGNPTADNIKFVNNGLHITSSNVSLTAGNTSIATNEFNLDAGNIEISSQQASMSLGEGKIILSGSTTPVIKINGGEISASNFFVSKIGEMTASAGKVGGFTINSRSIKSDNLILDSTDKTLQLGTVTDFSNDDSSKVGLFAEGINGQFFVGKETEDFIHFDGTNLTIKSDNLNITASDIDMTTTEFDLNAGEGDLEISSVNRQISLANGNIVLDGDSNSDAGHILVGTLTGPGDTTSERTGLYAVGDGRILLKASSSNYIKLNNDNVEIKSTNVDISGSDVNIQTPSFMFGDKGTSFISSSTNQIEISSSNFHLLGGNITASNVSMSGNITAQSGDIGGFTIGTNKISSTNLVISSSAGTGEIISASNFNVKANGQVTASNVDISGKITATSGEFTGTLSSSVGNIGGFTINDNKISSTNLVLSSSTGTGEIISASNFNVKADGQVTASNVDISGKITATSGEVGGFTIDGHSITTDGVEINDITQDVFINTSNFNVSHTGNITASNVSMSGEINALTGTIGGFTITETEISASNLLLKSTGQLTASNVDLSGKITATSGEVGGFEVTDSHISASNLFMKSSGQITGSKVLFDGGIVGGFVVSTDKLQTSESADGANLNIFNLTDTGILEAGKFSDSHLIVSSIGATREGSTSINKPGFSISNTTEQGWGSNLQKNASIIRIDAGICRANFYEITGSEVFVEDDLIVGDSLDVDGQTNLDNTDIDGNLTVDSTNISLDANGTFNLDNANTSNGITINTATNNGTISIGHTNSETTVNDNLSVTNDLTIGGDISGSSTSNITVGGDISSSGFVYDETRDKTSETTLSDDNVWKTIAICKTQGNDRATATFVLTDEDSGHHSAYTFNATFHFSKSGITVYNGGYYGNGGVFDGLRILTGGVHDGGVLQVHIADGAGAVTSAQVHMYHNSHDETGWELERFTTTVDAGEGTLSTVNTEVDLRVNEYQDTDQNQQGFISTAGASFQGQITASNVVRSNDYPAFSARCNGSDGIDAAGEWQSIIMDEELFDNGGDFDHTAGIPKFTAPIKGLYQFNLNVTIENYDSDLDDFAIRLRWNNGDDYGHKYDLNNMLEADPSGTGTHHSFGFSKSLILEAGDQIYPQHFADDTDGTFDEAANVGTGTDKLTHLTWFDGHLITPL